MQRATTNTIYVDATYWVTIDGVRTRKAAGPAAVTIRQCALCVQKLPGQVCSPNFDGYSSSVIDDANPTYRISASNVTWVYDAEASTECTAVYHPRGMVHFEPIDMGTCYQISPTTAVIDPSGGELRIDLTQDPPAWEGFGVTLWAATYSDTCNGGEAMAGAGGAWFMGSGVTSPNGSRISGTSSGSGQTFTYDFVRP
jgi:hypothetical protein